MSSFLLLLFVRVRNFSEMNEVSLAPHDHSDHARFTHERDRRIEAHMAKIMGQHGACLERESRMVIRVEGMSGF